MNRAIISEKLPAPGNILVAPLDWGLGHAARCVPLIRHWLKEGHHVTVAAEGRTKALLQKHFPDIEFITLEGYEINYGRRLPLSVALSLQLPKFFRSVRMEHDWLETLLKQRSFDLVVSDNRYGLWSKQTRCVLITHQLFVKAPSLFSWMEPFVHRQLHRMIASFDECWIPDVEGGGSLSGELSQHRPLPENHRFIGCLSRFEGSTVNQGKFKCYDRLILISGPEPQRSILEKRLLDFASSSDGSTIIVQGLPERQQETVSGNVRIVSHLEDDEMLHAILNSKEIICRSGYSTLMDLVTLKKSAILVPTPGQTEQVYLARRMNEIHGWKVLQQGRHGQL